jgi:cytoskeleton protein RodZ
MAIKFTQKDLTGIAKALKAARKLKGAKLEEVSHDTKLKKKFIKALESGDIDAIGFDVYYVGYLKTYCKYLNLDIEKILENTEKIDNRKLDGIASKNIITSKDFMPSPVLIIIITMLAIAAMILLN